LLPAHQPRCPLTDRKVRWSRGWPRSTNRLLYQKSDVRNRLAR